MKRMVWAFLGPLFFVTIAFGHAAQAAEPVAVEQFDGPDADKLRKAVLDALKKTADFTAVPDKKLASVEADLGLMQASDAYEAVAKQLGAIGFIKGQVKGRGKVTGTVTVHDASGQVVGSPSITGKNTRDLLTKANKQLPGILKPLLDRASSRSGAVLAVASAPAAPKEERKRVPQEEEDELDEVDDRRSERDNRSDAAVTASIDTRDRDDDKPWTRLDVFASAMLYQRNFSYNQLAKGPNGSCTTSPPADGCQLEQNGPAFAVALAADYFFLPYLGLTAGGEFTVATGATQAGVDGTFPIKSMLFFVGPKGKWNFSDLEVNGQVTYGQHSFEVAANGDTFANVAPVNYSQVRALAGARYDLGPLALLGGGGYLYVLSPGIIADDFPGTTATGVEANLGVAMGLPFLAKGLEGRVSAVFRQYALTMDSRRNDDHIAGGATDRYIGINFGAAFRMK